MRDTQFISMFWLKTLENQVKCILPCTVLEHMGGINLYFDMKYDLKQNYCPGPDNDSVIKK